MADKEQGHEMTDEEQDSSEGHGISIKKVAAGAAVGVAVPAAVVVAKRLVGGNGDDSGVLRQLLGHDLIERVRRCVVVVEIKAIVLDWTETRDTQFRQRSDIRAARMLGEIKNAGAGALQDFRDRVEESFSFRFRCEAHPERVTGTAIGLDRGEMIRDFIGMLLCVSFTDHDSIFFIHPRDHTNRSLRAKMKFLD